MKNKEAVVTVSSFHVTLSIKLVNFLLISTRFRTCIEKSTLTAEAIIFPECFYLFWPKMHSRFCVFSSSSAPICVFYVSMFAILLSKFHENQIENLLRNASLRRAKKRLSSLEDLSVSVIMPSNFNSGATEKKFISTFVQSSMEWNLFRDFAFRFDEDKLFFIQFFPFVKYIFRVLRALVLQYIAFEGNKTFLTKKKLRDCHAMETSNNWL